MLAGTIIDKVVYGEKKERMTQNRAPSKRKRLVERLRKRWQHRVKSDAENVNWRDSVTNKERRLTVKYERLNIVGEGVVVMLLRPVELSKRKQIQNVNERFRCFT